MAHIDRRGHCFACGVIGPPDRTRDFLCGNCAHPEKIIYICRSCHERKELQVIPETFQMLREHCPTIPERPGITVVVDRCETCRAPDDPDGNVEFYSLQPQEYH